MLMDSLGSITLFMSNPGSSTASLSLNELNTVALELNSSPFLEFSY